MRCPSCDTENRAARRYCRECGSGLEAEACASCGFENYEGEKYCGGCGQRREDRRDVAETVRPVVVPAAREAERRQMTVMFCDLVGSTALSRALDAEDLRDLITEFQEVCAVQIRRCDGFIARYMGDGMLVYFGYPQAREDSAERAVRAGLAIVAAVGALSREPVARSVRVGIATGRVVVGDLIGEGASEERAVVGETPNLAARLQSLAEPDTVLIADSTRRLVGDHFQLEDLGGHELKGFAEPVQAWRVTGERDAVAELEAEHLTERAELVGREFELALLVDRWKAVRSGQGRAVVLVGDAGSGKSRLVGEAIELCEVPPSSVLRYHCARHYSGTALRPVIEQVVRAAGFDVQDDESVRLEKLTRWVDEWSPDPDTHLPVFAALTSVSLEGGPGLVGTPEENKAAMLSAIWARLKHHIAESPPLVIFEDVQWADETTLQLVTGLLETAASAQLMVVATYRTEFDPPWPRGSHLASLSIGRLASQHARGLVRSLAGERRLPPPIVDQIVQRADGVPAYLVELTRAVLSAPERTGSSSASEFVVPETLLDSLAAQLDGLDAGTREIAQIAAVVGREFSETLLRHVYGGGGDALRDGLSALVAAGLVVPPGLEQGSNYAFRQALLREVAYQSLLKRTQRQLHDRIATALIEALPTEAQSDPESVAWHLEEAERWAEAASWWRKAGARAADLASVDAATSFYERAVTALDHSGVDDRDTAERRAELLVLIAEQLRLTVDLEASHAVLARAEELAVEHDLPVIASRVWSVRGNLAFRSSDFDACYEAHVRAREEARRGGSIEEEARALGGIADAKMARGDCVAGEEARRLCIELADAHGLERIAAANAAAHGYLLHWSLRAKEALAVSRDAVARAKRVHVPRPYVLAMQNVSYILADGGDIDEAERVMKELAATGRVSDHLLERFGSLVDARILRGRGRHADADALFRRQLGEPGGSSHFRSVFALGSLSTAPDEEYERGLAENLAVYADGKPSHFRLLAIGYAIEGALMRRNLDALARILEATRGVRANSNVPVVNLWVDASQALLTWASTPDDVSARNELERLCAHARECGQVVLDIAFRPYLDGGGAVDRASTSA